jgi:hypothetical protein
MAGSGQHTLQTSTHVTCDLFLWRFKGYYLQKESTHNSKLKHEISAAVISAYVNTLVGQVQNCQRQVALDAKDRWLWMPKVNILNMFPFDFHPPETAMLSSTKHNDMFVTYFGKQPICN